MTRTCQICTYIRYEWRDLCLVVQGIPINGLEPRMAAYMVQFFRWSPAQPLGWIPLEKLAEIVNQLSPARIDNH